MATVNIKVSDITGQYIETDDELVQVEVSHHRALDKPVRIDASRDEVKLLMAASRDAVVLSFTTAGDPGEIPERIIVDRAEFEGQFQDDPLAVLSAVQQEPRHRQTAGRPKPDRLDYTAIENAGQPHRGRTTEAEQRVVRENLAEVNRRRAINGHDPIDPANPRDAARYGFELYAQAARKVKQEHDYADQYAEQRGDAVPYSVFKQDDVGEVPQKHRKDEVD
jgi:hypothetical protein